MQAIDLLKIRTQEQIDADIAAGTQVAPRCIEELRNMCLNYVPGIVKVPMKSVIEYTIKIHGR